MRIQLHSRCLGVLNYLGLDAAENPAAREAQLKKQANIALKIWYGLLGSATLLRLISDPYNVAPGLLAVGFTADFFSGERETKLIIRKLKKLKEDAEGLGYRLNPLILLNKEEYFFPTWGTRIFAVIIALWLVLNVAFTTLIAQRNYRAAIEEASSTYKNVTDILFLSDYRPCPLFSLCSGSLYFMVILLAGLGFHHCHLIGKPISEMITLFSFGLAVSMWTVWVTLLVGRIRPATRTQEFLLNNATFSEAIQTYTDLAAKIGNDSYLFIFKRLTFILEILMNGAAYLASMFMGNKTTMLSIQIDQYYFFAALSILLGGYENTSLTFSTAAIISAILAATGKVTRRFFLNEKLNKFLQESEAMLSARRLDVQQSTGASESEIAKETAIEMPSRHADLSLPTLRMRENPLYQHRAAYEESKQQLDGVALPSHRR